MDRRIRQIAFLLTLLLLAITVSAGWVQGIRAETIAASEPVNPHNTSERGRNPFRIFQECRWERGPILSIDGKALADNKRVSSGKHCLYERTYPLGKLAAHVVGQWSLYYGKTGLEAAYNKDLVGEPPRPRSLSDVFNQQPRVGNTLVSTLDTRLQKAALDALGDRRGGVVALDPKTGAVFVAASNPSYDPNALASNNRAFATRARCKLGLGYVLDDSGHYVLDADGNRTTCKNPDAPLVSVALQARRPPGSSFKVVTAAAALESGKYTPDTRIPYSGAYLAPGESRGNAIHNFGGGSCGGALRDALRVSCNTAFARVAVDIGEDQLLRTADALGLDQYGGSDFVGCEGGPISDIAETRTGCLPSEILRASPQPDERLHTPGFRARAGFGQWVIQVSPFGMAVVAATVANGGFVPKPRFADKVLDREGHVVRDIRTGIGAAAIAPSAAADLTSMMQGVVRAGTAASAFRGFHVEGSRTLTANNVAGKTGTAQQPSCPSDEQAIFGANCGRLPHAWFIAFAPADDPAIAIAVLVERGGGNNEAATGGRLAAPVARKVLEEFFRLYPDRAGVAGGQG